MAYAVVPTLLLQAPRSAAPAAPTPTVSQVSASAKAHKPQQHMGYVHSLQSELPVQHRQTLALRANALVIKLLQEHALHYRLDRPVSPQHSVLLTVSALYL